MTTNLPTVKHFALILCKTSQCHAVTHVKMTPIFKFQIRFSKISKNSKNEEDALNFKVSWWPGNVVLAIPRGQLVLQNFLGEHGDKNFLTQHGSKKFFVIIQECHAYMSEKDGRYVTFFKDNKVIFSALITPFL